MAPKLYYFPESPVARATLLTIKALNIDVEHKLVDPLKGEHMTPEYLKMNPQHTVPTLQDGDFAIWDSHAINAYLVGKYGKDDSLYPKDLQKRAVVDQRLHFDSGILFPRGADIVRPIIREGVKTVPKEKADLVVAAYEFLEKFLEKYPYMAGDALTIADFSIVAGISTISTLVPLVPDRFPKLCDWFSRMRTLPYYDDANQKGLKTLLIKMILSINRLSAFLKSKMS